MSNGNKPISYYSCYTNEQEMGGLWTKLTLKQDLIFSPLDFSFIVKV